MPDATIGTWTKAQLNKFIQNAIATEPLVLPKQITVPTVVVTKKLIVQGNVELGATAVNDLFNYLDPLNP